MLCYRFSILFAFSCGQAKKIFEYATRGHEFSLKRRKKSWFSKKYADTCGRGLNVKLEPSIHHLYMPHPFNQLPFPQSQRPVS